MRPAPLLHATALCALPARPAAGGTLQNRSLVFGWRDWATAGLWDRRFVTEALAWISATGGFRYDVVDLSEWATQLPNATDTCSEAMCVYYCHAFGAGPGEHAAPPPGERWWREVPRPHDAVVAPAPLPDAGGVPGRATPPVEVAAGIDLPSYSSHRQACGVKYSVPFLLYGFQMVAMKPAALRDSASWWRFTEPFERQVWFALLGLIAFNALIMWVLEGHGENKVDFPSHYDTSSSGSSADTPGGSQISTSPLLTKARYHCRRAVVVWCAKSGKRHAFTSLYRSFGSALGNPTFTPKTPSGRVFTIIWLFFVLTIVAMYTANLASIFTRDVPTKGITSISDLATTGKLLCVGPASSVHWSPNGTLMTFLRRNYPHVRTSRVQDDLDGDGDVDLSDVFMAVIDGSSNCSAALDYDYVVVDHFAALRHDPRFCGLHAVGGVLGHKNKGIIFRADINDTDLSEFNTLILRWLEEEHTDNAATGRFGQYGPLSSPCPDTPYSETGSRSDKIILTDIWGLICLLLIWGAGSIVLKMTRLFVLPKLRSVCRRRPRSPRLHLQRTDGPTSAALSPPPPSPTPARPPTPPRS